jgi:hypothetical protein
MTMLAPASRACLIVDSRESAVIIKIGMVRCSLSFLPRIARVSWRPPCRGSRASQTKRSMRWAVSAWNTPIELRTSSTLLEPKPLSMLWISMLMYEL